MRLIKFHGMSKFLLANLELQQLYFNNVFNFNDPFEGSFRYKSYTDHEEFKEFYLKHFSGRPEKLEHYYNHPYEFEGLLNRTNNWRFDNVGITCFSEEDNDRNILMWSHYAKSDTGNSHEGICLVFETDDLTFSPREPLQDGVLIGKAGGPYQVNYSDQYLSGDPLTRQLNTDTFLTTKFTPWNYEKEYRYIAGRSGLYNFSKNALKEIIFGLRLSADDKETFRSVFEYSYPWAKLSMIKVKSDHFAFEKVDYKHL